MTRNSTDKPYVQLVRSDDVEEIIKHNSNAFILLTIIAMRARRKSDDCRFTKLKQGQAFVGDYKECGLTRQQYRTALKWLEANQYVTIKTTTKGTTVTLIDSTVYDINPEGGNHQGNQELTKCQPTPNHKEECKKAKNEKKESSETSKNSTNQKTILQQLEEMTVARRSAFEEWLEYKQEKKQTYKPKGFQKLVAQFMGSTDAEVQASVDKSMAMNYTGLFADKSKPNQPTGYSGVV